MFPISPTHSEQSAAENEGEYEVTPSSKSNVETLLPKLSSPEESIDYIDVNIGYVSVSH